MKKYELDAAQNGELEKSFLLSPPRDGHQQKLESINEKLMQAAKYLFSLTPKSPEQSQGLLKLREAKLWFEEAIRKNEIT